MVRLRLAVRASVALVLLESLWQEQLESQESTALACDWNGC